MDEEFYAVDRATWCAWLAANADRPTGVWVLYDKGAGGLTYDDIVEEAVCYGWIDSKVRRRSETQALLYVAPRRPASFWSRSNKERVERLMAAGLMQPRGLALIETAKANGSWIALDSVEALEVPPDLAEALAAREGARAAWDAFPRSARRAILDWILSAKRPETRRSRIRETADEAAQGRRTNEWRR